MYGRITYAWSDENDVNGLSKNHVETDKYDVSAFSALKMGLFLDALHLNAFSCELKRISGMHMLVFCRTTPYITSPLIPTSEMPLYAKDSRPYHDRPRRFNNVDNHNTSKTLINQSTNQSLLESSNQTLWN